MAAAASATEDAGAPVIGGAQSPVDAALPASVTAASPAFSEDALDVMLRNRPLLRIRKLQAFGARDPLLARIDEAESTHPVQHRSR